MMSAHLSEQNDLKHLSRDLRAEEPRITKAIHGDVGAICSLCRYLCWCATHGRILPDFCDLPDRLIRKTTEYQFEILYGRIELIASRYDNSELQLRPIKGVHYQHDQDKERARREKIYARQWARTMLRSGRGIGNRYNKGPAARPVEWVRIGDLLQQEIVVPFRSARAAAIHFGVDPSDVRNAINRKHRVRGCTLRYSTTSGGNIIPNGIQRSVRSKTTGTEYPSIAAAARSMEISHSLFRVMLMAGQPVKGQIFELIHDSQMSGPQSMSLSRAA